MAHSSTIKALNPIDIKLPDHIVKGAALVDPSLSEWNPEIMLPFQRGSTFLMINKETEDVTNLTERVAHQLGLPEGNVYGLLLESPRQFLTASNMNSLSNGFFLIVTVSQSEFLSRINDALSLDDLSKVEWAAAKFSEFPMSPSLAQQLDNVPIIETVFSCLQKEAALASATATTRCLEAVGSLLDLRQQHSGWRPIREDAVSTVASFVTGRSKREDTNIVIAALQLLEQFINYNNGPLNEFVLKEVALESLVRHLEKSDERVAVASLSLMNALLRISSEERRAEALENLQNVPFRSVVKRMLCREGKARNLAMIEQLVELHKMKTRYIDTSPASEAEIQRIVENEIIKTSAGQESAEGSEKALRENKCGRLATSTILQLIESNSQDLKLLIFENLMRPEGGKWSLIPMCIICNYIVAELFGILPGDEVIEKMIELIFSEENNYQEVFTATVYLFHRTWREMVASEVELEKVQNIVREQMQRAMLNGPSSIQELNAELEKLSYWKMQEIWEKEEQEKENNQMMTGSMVALRSKLQPVIEDLVRTKFRYYLKSGYKFSKTFKGKSSNKGTFWLWKLDNTEKFFTLTTCDEDTMIAAATAENDSRQVWLRDVVKVSGGEELERSNKPSSTPSRSLTQNLVRVHLNDGEVLAASTFDERVAAIWIEGLTQLIDKNKMSKDAMNRVDQLLNMEIRVRMLGISRQKMSTDMFALKRQLREKMAGLLARIPEEEVVSQSSSVCEKVFAADWYKNSKRISVYVNTSGEVMTDRIVLNALESGKEVFIPQFKKGNPEMKMMKLSSREQFEALDKTLWNIRQPAQDADWPLYENSGPLDLVLLPGVAFSRKMHRLGHGKGFYDKMLHNHENQFGKMPERVALALTQQVIDDVPITDNDVLLTHISLKETVSMSQDMFVDHWNPGGSMDDDELGVSSGKYARLDGEEMGENKERFARENHSEIERRRRNKMTHYINELAEMVPQCAALGRKPDKLTILRMAVSHMKAIRGNSGQDEPSYKPSFLTDQELKHLILEAANGFLFVVCCQTGRVLYVADSILPVLNLKQEEWLQRNFNELIHPEDQDKVRDQLSGGEVAVNKVLDLKSGGVKRDGVSSRVHMSCRRGFICRMRVGDLEPLHRLRNRRPIFNQDGNNYVVMHCTGYIKNTPPSGIDAAASSCLIAIARLQLASMPVCADPATRDQFSVRVAEDGKMTFIDSRVTELIGLSVDQLIGRYWWSLAHPSDEKMMNDAFLALMRDQPLRLNCRIRTQTDYLPYIITAYKFMNPYSEQFEYVVGTHQAMSPEEGATWSVSSSNNNNFQPNVEFNPPPQVAAPWRSVETNADASSQWQWDVPFEPQ
ncbi:unnamed protein product [Caenorhabditis auriculariae]|uniref:Aryl hydrocarbon receptor nuclear translocator homolog n=1 Tax=Caenorhabditis auriculariae TaxID=2777116 RepID=A0A8S1GNI5_9PELO|nr:unnamed protein product [Caenorhabditis auriculariae]